MQQEAADLVVELAVEPLQQATGLGALGRVATEQRRLGMGLFQVVEDGAAFAQHQRFATAAHDQHGRQARGVEPHQRLGPFPVADRLLGERQPLFAQREADLPGGGIQGEMKEGEVEAHQATEYR